MNAIMAADGTVSAIVPQIWSQRFTDNLRAALPWVDSVAKDYEGEVKNLGDRVLIPTLPDGAEADVIQEGASADAKATTAFTTPLIINKQVVWDFIVTGISRLQSISYMDQMRDIAINAIMQKMQSIIMDEISPSSSAPDHTIAYASGTTLAYADILSAKRLLDAQNVPKPGRVLISGTGQSNDLLNVINFVNSQYNGGDAASKSGQVNGQVLGFVPKDTTANANSTYCFHPSFLQMAVQKSLSIGIYDLGVVGERSFRVNVDLLFGVKQVHDERIVSIN